MKNSRELEIQPRQLKVYPKYFYRVNSWRPVIYPEIRLCGKWLQEMGFEHGQTVTVLQEKNKITIIMDDEIQKQTP